MTDVVHTSRVIAAEVPDVVLAHPVDSSSAEQRIRVETTATVSSILMGVLSSEYDLADVTLRTATTINEYKSVVRARAAAYNSRDTYMTRVVGVDGFDAYDHRSHLFYAEAHGKILASVRLTPSPHEVAKYVPLSTLDLTLLDCAVDDLIEVSRLVVDRAAANTRLGEALLYFACTTATIILNKQFYVAYARPRLKARSFLFASGHELAQFDIPERGNQSYVLFIGDMNAVADEVLARYPMAASQLRLIKGTMG